MITTHKQFIELVTDFCDRNYYINDFKYMKDKELVSEVVVGMEPKGFLLSLNDVSLDLSGYNLILTYDFILTDKTGLKDLEIVNTESEHIQIMLSLLTSINSEIQDSVNISNMEVVTEQDDNYTYSSIVGSISLNIKTLKDYIEINKD